MFNNLLPQIVPLLW